MITEKDVKFLKNVLNLENNKIDFSLLLKFLSVIKDDKKIKRDLLDSVSNNQFTSKTKLIELINSLNILNKNSEIIIFGGWYGSIFIPKLSPLVKRITIIDMNEKIIRLSKNRLFNHYKNVDFINDDIFFKFRGRYSETKLFINTSCEHMSSMKNWPWWNQVNKDSYFAFQSNNMFNIETHINCVNNINEFKKQLPEKSKILIENEMIQERGKIFMLLGKL